MDAAIISRANRKRRKIILSYLRDRRKVQTSEYSHQTNKNIPLPNLEGLPRSSQTKNAAISRENRKRRKIILSH